MSQYFRILITANVDQNNTRFLFGCSSFAGLDAARYLDVFALLKTRYLAPERWRPRKKASDVFHFVNRLDRLDIKLAVARLPPPGSCEFSGMLSLLSPAYMVQQS